MNGETRLYRCISDQLQNNIYSELFVITGGGSIESGKKLRVT